MTPGAAPPARRGALVVALWLAGRGGGARRRLARPLRRRPVGVPAVGADARAGGAARPAARAARPRACSSSASKAARRRRGSRGRARRGVEARGRGAARERRVRVGPQRRERGLGRRRPLPVRAPLRAQPGGRRRSASASTGLRDGDRRDRLAARHAGRLAAQADPLSRPDRRDAAHRRGADAGARAEDRARRLGLAPGAARGAGGDDRAPTAPTSTASSAPSPRIRSAFDAAPTPGLRLVVSGAGKFAVESRERIKGEVERLAVLGWRSSSSSCSGSRSRRCARSRSRCCRSRPASLAGIAAVSLGFGQVHGMTLGFGTTLIGEAVDYAIYYLIQARGGNGAARALAARELADGAARPLHLADRLRRARLHRLSRPGAARRVLDRRPRRRGGDDALRLSGARAGRRAGRRLSPPARAAS